MISKKRLQSYVDYYKNLFELKKISIPESRKNISFNTNYAKFVLSNKKSIKEYIKKETVELKINKIDDFNLFDLETFKKYMVVNNLRYYSLLMNFITENDLMAGNKNGQSLSKFISKAYDDYCREGKIYNDPYFIQDFNHSFSMGNQNNVPITTFPLYLTLSYSPEAFISLGFLGPDSGSCFNESSGGNYFRKYEIAFQPGSAVFYASTKPDIFGSNKNDPGVLSRSLVVLQNNKFHIFNNYTIANKVSKLACAKLFTMFLNHKLGIKTEKTAIDTTFTGSFYTNGDTVSYAIKK